MSSDFAMARFRFLSNLLLVHGHWNYYRLAQTILYFFYKNAMLVFVIFWYQIFNGFSAQVPIDPVYLMVYNLIFTSVPPLLFGCLDQDASAELLLDCPRLYEQGRLGKRYRWYSFWINMLDAVWQSLVVFFICYFVSFEYKLNWELGKSWNLIFKNISKIFFQKSLISKNLKPFGPKFHILEEKFYDFYIIFYRHIVEVTLICGHSDICWWLN